MGTLETALRRPTLTWRDTAAAYLSLSKPRIITLLLITTVPAMILADKGLPSMWLMLATVVGGTLAAGGANAFNCYLDRDIDELMHRTQRRPLPARHDRAGERADVRPHSRGGGVRAARTFIEPARGVARDVGDAVLRLRVHDVAEAADVAEHRHRRRSGRRAAARRMGGRYGHVGVPAVILFAIIFLWTPPHFWALSIKYRDDYARASVPMLPVVATLESTKNQIFAYTLLLVPVSLALIATGTVGWIYGASAVVLGGMFIREAWRLRSNDAPGAAMGVFRASITYLALIFVAVGADQLILR